MSDPPKELQDWPPDVMEGYSKLMDVVWKSNEIFVTTLIGKGYDAKEVWENLAQSHEAMAADIRKKLFNG